MIVLSWPSHWHMKTILQYVQYFRGCIYNSYIFRWRLHSLLINFHRVDKPVRIIKCTRDTCDICFASRISGLC